MLNQLSRPEAVNIKNDIHEIARSLATIASSIPDTATAKTESAVENGDPFFGKIHMSQEHMDAWDKEFDTTCLSMIGLMEECAELQQAASKYYRKYRITDDAHCAAEKAAMIEEMAHVMIDIRMICHDLDISPEEIQQEIYKKYPEGYDVVTYMAENKPYYMERTKGSE